MLAQVSAGPEVGGEVQVTADDPTGVYVEPTIAVDPSDPTRMAIAAIHLRDPHADAWQDRQTVVVFASRDGGRSWSRRDLATLPADWFAGDQWLAWGADATLYLTAIAGESLTRRGSVYYTSLFRSPDGGWTWPEVPQHPFESGTFQDHPVMLSAGPDLAIVGTIADGSGEGVYVTRCATCAVARASGMPWGGTQRIVPGGTQLNLGGAALLPDGAIVVSYYTMSPPRRYWTSPSSSGAGEATLLADDILPMGFPAVAAEPRGNRVATVWVERISAGWHLRTVTSDDGGGNWSPPVDIHPAHARGLPMLPAIALSSVGSVAVTWQERDADTECSRLFAAFRTRARVPAFTQPVPVSTAPSCPTTGASGAAAYRFRYGGGDYMGLAPAGSGAFQAVWADARDGSFQIYTARLRSWGR